MPCGAGTTGFFWAVGPPRLLGFFGPPTALCAAADPAEIASRIAAKVSMFFIRRLLQLGPCVPPGQRAAGRFSLTCCAVVVGASSRAHLRQSSDAQLVGQPPPSAMNRAAVSDRRVAWAWTRTTAAFR